MDKYPDDLVNEKCALLGLQILLYQIKFIGQHPDFETEFYHKDGRVKRRKLKQALRQFAEKEIPRKT